MALSIQQIAELQILAKRFVAASVHCNIFDTKRIVCGNLCDSIDRAVEIAVERCARAPVSPEDVEEQDALLRGMLSREILKMDCD